MSLKLVWQSDKNKHYSPAPAMGLRSPSMGFSQSLFYFYSVMTQTGARIAQQALRISMFVKVQWQGERQIVRLSAGRGASMRERERVFSGPSGVSKAF